jgi:hypothetical protein
MITIELVVTGDLEEAALAHFLDQILQTWSPNIAITFQTRKISGFTSRTLPASLPADASAETASVEFFAAAISALTRRSKAVSSLKKPDYVIAVEDVEVANHHQPCIVRDYARASAAFWLASQTSQLAVDANQRVSFHFLHLMAENYLLADATLTATLGLAAHPAATTMDPEFVIDPSNSAWLAHCQARNTRMSNIGYSHWREELHAKNWLNWQIEQHQPAARYKEKDQGAQALRNLDPATLWRQPDHCPWLAALILDLCDMCGVTPPANVAVRPSPLTWPHQASLPAPKNLILRNL